MPGNTPFTNPAAIPGNTLSCDTEAQLLNSYYDDRADAFIAGTLLLDMSEHYRRFESRLSGPGRILDVGCGPGRDLKYFKSRGFNVLGLEPSATLAHFARDHAGCEVLETHIQDFDSPERFAGIWACASLLHLSTPELIQVLEKLAGMLTSEGALYCSFRYGDFEGKRDGRFFNDQTLTSFEALLPGSLFLEKSWFSEDLRPDKQQIWFNAILKQA